MIDTINIPAWLYIVGCLNKLGHILLVAGQVPKLWANFSSSYVFYYLESLLVAINEMEVIFSSVLILIQEIVPIIAAFVYQNVGF